MEFITGIEFIAVDGVVVRGEELPPSIESIVFSNIPAYAGKPSK